MTKKQFYVVVLGRQPGIYQEWFGEDGAAEQVEGLEEAIFKGFGTLEEALEWLRGFGAETLLRLAPDLLDLIEPRALPRKPKSPEDWLKAGKVLIYTDGRAIDKPGPGGYGVVLCFREHRKELSGGFRRTTNHRMELTACIEGLKALKSTCSVILIIDDVPAWVCEQCGEPLFDEKTVDAIQELLQGVDTRLKDSALAFAAA